MFQAAFNDGALVDGEGAYRLNGGGDYLAVAQDVAFLSQRQFEVSLDFKSDQANAGGTLFDFPGALHIGLNPLGQVVFSLLDNKAGERGTFAAKTVKTDDGGWHGLKLIYDADAGFLTGVVDGVTVGRIAVSAPLKAAAAPAIGSTTAASVAGWVDNVHIGAAGAIQSTSTAQSLTGYHATFDGGARIDALGTGATVSRGNATSITDGAYYLDGARGGNFLAVGKDAGLYGQRQFDLSFDFKTVKPGLLFQAKGHFDITVTKMDTVVVRLLGNAADERGSITAREVGPGQWHTFKLKYDADANQMSLAIDGRDAGGLTISAPTKAAPKSDATFGADRGFAGLIDNIHVTPGQTVINAVAQGVSGNGSGTSVFQADFEQSAVVDLAPAGAGVAKGTDADISNGAYYLNGAAAAKGGNAIVLDHDATLYSQSHLEVSLDFRSAKAGAGGVLFQMPKAFEIAVGGNGQLVFRLLGNAAKQKGTIDTKIKVADAQWHNAKFVYDADAGKMVAYVDGEELGSLKVTGSTAFAAVAGDASFGSAVKGGFRGYIDNVEVRSGDAAVAAPAHVAAPAQALTVSEQLDVAKPHYATPVLANNSAELEAALRNAKGGETILLRSDVDYKASVSTWAAHSSTVTVTSLDPSKQATITGLDLRDAQKLTFDNLHFEFKGTPASQWQYDVYVRNSKDIAFVDSVFKGIASGFGNEKVAPSMLSVEGSDNVRFHGNEISHYWHGIESWRSTHLSYTDNDFHHMQADGMRFAQVQGVTVDGNWMHDFLGSLGSLNHNDYMQFWTASTTAPSRDIVIRGNILANGGPQSQAIFFRDELGDSGSTATRFKNVLIEENYIYNNHLHGITIGNADGLTIHGNTLGVMPNGQYNMTSQINVSNSTAVSVTDNFVPNVVVSGSDVLANFSNVRPAALTAIVTGEMTGSRAFEFDARYTANANGYVGASDAQFLWDFGDGATASGLHATHTYANSADHTVLLTVLHHNGTSDTARVHTVAENDVADVNGSIASLHDLWN